MDQRSVTTLPHRDRQNSKARAHGKILMSIGLFASARRLVVNAFRRRNVIHLPLATESITEIQILTRRAAVKERSKPPGRVKRMTTHCTRSTTNPLARHGLIGCGWKSIRKCRSDQTSGLKAFHASVQEHPVDSPEESGCRHRLVDQSTHRRTNCRIVPYRCEEFLHPMRIN